MIALLFSSMLFVLCMCGTFSYSDFDPRGFRREGFSEAIFIHDVCYLFDLS